MIRKLGRLLINFARPTILGFFVIVTLIQAGLTFGTYYQNESSGYFLVDFNGSEQGIVSAGDPERENITVDTIAGIAGITDPETSGFFTTNEIEPASVDSWDKITMVANHADIAGSDVTITVNDCSGNNLIPATPFDLIAGVNGIDISSISNTETCIKVRVDLAEYNSINPTIDWLKVKWNPEPVYLLSMPAPSNASAGSSVNFSIGYSVSYVNDTNTIIWAPLPTAVGGTFTGAFNQTLETTFISATNGGTFTSSNITVAGVDIPADSIYWNLGSVSAGSAGTLIFKVATTNGTENGVQFETAAHIDSTIGTETLSDSDIGTIGNQSTSFVVESAPIPSITKAVDGVMNFSDNNYVIDSPPNYTPTVTYNVSMSNSPEIGTETIFNPVIVDDLTDIATKMNASCGLSAAQILTKITPANGGALSLVGTFPNYTITWDQNDLADILPGNTDAVSYTVDYTACMGTVLTFENIVAGTSDNNPSINVDSLIEVITDTPTLPSIILKKGDKVNAVSSIKINSDDNESSIQPYGDNFSYLLGASNTGAVTVGDIVLYDQIPTGETFRYLNSSGATSKLYYAITPTKPDTSTFTSGAAGGLTDSDWLTSVPVDPSTVKWVAAFVPCLDSRFFPAPALNTVCHGESSNINLEVGVTIDGPEICSLTNFTNTVYAETNAKSSNISTQALLPIAVINSSDAEQTHAGPRKPSFANGGVNISGDLNTTVGGVGNYTITINNNGNDSAVGTTVVVQAPYVKLDGSVGYLPFNGTPTVTGGSSTFTYTVDTTTVVFTAPIAPGATRTITVPIYIEEGELKNADTFKITAILSADDDNCGPVNGSGQMIANVTAHPKLVTYKNVDESIIDSAGDIHYTIKYTNNGNSPTTNSYIVDKVPAHTTFKYAYTNGTDANGNTFTCTYCRVYFSNDTGVNYPNAGPPHAMPPSLSVTTPLDDNFTDAFTLGTNSFGVWTSPYSDQTTWVIYELSNTSGLYGITKPGESETVGLTVTNDNNGIDVGTDGSTTGTTITNATGIFSHELLQAINNQVITTILPDPGLRINKESYGLAPNSSVIKDVVYAGESFNWKVDFYNDSGNDDTSVILTDIFPTNSTLGAIYFTWNSDAITNGMPAGEFELCDSNNSCSDPNTTITTNLNGTKTIILDVVAMRGESLRNLEGGTLRIVSTTDANLGTGMESINTISGAYINSSNSLVVADVDNVIIENPDLMIQKFVDMSDPIGGDTVGYHLRVQNIGEHDDTGVKIVDTLPAGLCYDTGGSTTVTSVASTWTIGEPTISAGDCNFVSTTLTWDSVLEDVGSGTDAGYMPANSTLITINYPVVVYSDIGPGVSLTNHATIEGDYAEDNLVNNTSSQNINTPLPDPYVSKTGQLITAGGEISEFTISYGNNTKQSAEGVYMIDTIPDYDGDTTPDMQFVSVTQSINGETFYFHDYTANPVFNYIDPLNVTNGWTTTPSANTAFIAILPPGGDLAGDAPQASVSIVLRAIDPDTLVNIPAGHELENSVEIFLSGTDASYDNNIATYTTHTPGIDLYITKTADHEGPIPGIEPGTPIAYTITLGNQGVEDACGVIITDSLSYNLNKDIVFENFSTSPLSLTDINNSIVLPHDALGANIYSSVPVVFDSNTNTWSIGGTLHGVDHLNTCLPPDSMLSFNVYATADTTDADGDVIADGDVLVNSITTSLDALTGAIEDITENNTDASNVSVYMPDVTVHKTGFSVANNDPNFVDINSLVEYKVEYQNKGNIDAQNVNITDPIPVDSCFVIGSITNLPTGATIEYFKNNLWSSTAPVDGGNGTDCGVKQIRINFDGPIGSATSFVSEGDSSPFNGTATNVTDITDLSLHSLNLDENMFSDNQELLLDNSNVLDFDDDGKLDVVVGGGLYHNMSTNGKFYFDQKLDFDVLGQISKVADFDNDNHLDVVVVYSSSPYVKLFRNTTFDGSCPADTICMDSGIIVGSTPSNDGSIYVEDFDNDGNIDIAFKTPYPTLIPTSVLYIYRNTTFDGSCDPNAICMDSVSTDITLPHTLSETIFVDIDGDGFKDVVSGGHTYGLDPAVSKVFRNTTGDGSCAADTICMDGSGISLLGVDSESKPVAEDLDEDGHIDLIFGGDNNSTKVFRNTTFDGSCAADTICMDSGVVFVTNLLYNLSTPLIADVDEDGHMDVIFTSFDNASISIMRNTTFDGSCAANTICVEEVQINGVHSLSSPLFVDVDEDGHKDLILSGVNFGNEYSNVVLRNTTFDGSCAANDICMSSGLILPLAPGTGYSENRSIPVFEDVDGDGHKDIILADRFYPKVFRNTTFDGSCAANTICTDSGTLLSGPQSLYSRPVFEDFDGDAIEDIILFSYVNYTTAIFHNTSTSGAITFDQPYKLSGNYTISLSSIPVGSQMLKLYVDEDIPADTSIEYSLQSVCGGSDVIYRTPATSGIIDLSSITSSGTNCLKIFFERDGGLSAPKINSWRISYEPLNPTIPYFSYRVRTNTTFTNSTFSNTATIVTSSSELDDTNNSSTYSMNINSADLEIIKHVNKVAGVDGDILSYTLDYINLGTKTARSVSITENIPSQFITDNFDYSATVTSNGQSITCGYDTYPQVVCNDSGSSFSSNLNLAPGESGQITFTLTITDPTPGANDKIINNATIASLYTLDSNLDNNSSTVTTFVGDFANVYVNKSAPQQIGISSDLTYTITYGNNGNVDATNTIITEDYDANTTFVSANPAPTSSDNVWDLGTLEPGDTGSITIVVHVPNDQNLLTSPATQIQNIVTIETNSNEASVGDNIDNATTSILPVGNASISGSVYNDSDEDGVRDIQEFGVAGVDIYIAGVDLFDNIIGPDKTLYPSEYETLMARMVTSNYLAGGPYLSSDNYPIQYFVNNPVSTSALSGNYSFGSLPQGHYFLLESPQPSDYTSTKSNAGYRSTSGGQPVYVSGQGEDGEGKYEDNNINENEILDINLLDGNQGREYNFGEYKEVDSIGGQIGDLVFQDVDGNGIYDGSDVGIGNVLVSLCADTNDNGVCNGFEYSQNVHTNSAGLYNFYGLTSGSKYIIKISHNNNPAINNKTAVFGAVGINNNGQDTNGYIVELTSLLPSNNTADFAFKNNSEGGGGGGCTSNCNPSEVTGTIGNLVFLDKNKNGVYDINDVGIPGVKVNLYKNSVLLASTTTSSCSILNMNLCGQYSFNNITLSSTLENFTIVIDPNNPKLKDYTNKFAVSTNDNVGKNPKGYSVALSNSIPTNNTADFAYITSKTLPQTGARLNIIILLTISLFAFIVKTSKILI